VRTRDISYSDGDGLPKIGISLNDDWTIGSDYDWTVRRQRSIHIHCTASDHNRWIFIWSYTTINLAAALDDQFRSLSNRHGTVNRRIRREDIGRVVIR